MFLELPFRVRVEPHGLQALEVNCAKRGVRISICLCGRRGSQCLGFTLLLFSRWLSLPHSLSLAPSLALSLFLSPPSLSPAVIILNTIRNQRFNAFLFKALYTRKLSPSLFPVLSLHVRDNDIRTIGSSYVNGHYFAAPYLSSFNSSNSKSYGGTRISNRTKSLSSHQAEAMYTGQWQREWQWQ